MLSVLICEERIMTGSKKTVVKRMPKEFDDYIEEVSGKLGVKSNDLMIKIARSRPIDVKPPLGHTVDKLFESFGLIPQSYRRNIIKKRKVIRK